MIAKCLPNIVISLLFWFFFSSHWLKSVFCVILDQSTFYVYVLNKCPIAFKTLQFCREMCARICPMYAWYYNPSNGILANEMFHNLPCNTNKMCLITLSCPGASCVSIWLWKLMKSHHDQRVCQQLTRALEAWKSPLEQKLPPHTYTAWLSWHDLFESRFLWKAAQLLPSQSSAVSPLKLVVCVTKCEGVCTQPCLSLCVFWPFFFNLAEFKWNLGIFRVVWQQAWLTESHDILLFDFALVLKVNC